MIGYLYGQYKKLRNEWVGILTGKPAGFGGSNIRPEATGYGLVYFTQHIMVRRRTTSNYSWSGGLVFVRPTGCRLRAARSCLQWSAAMLPRDHHACDCQQSASSSSLWPSRGLHRSSTSDKHTFRSCRRAVRRTR